MPLLIGVYLHRGQLLEKIGPGSILTSLAVLVRLVLSHQPHRQPDHIEGAHGVDHLDLKRTQRMSNETLRIRILV